jgi:uncharacterized spore protein YtfJ
MNVDELLREARNAMSARTVFAEPIERDGITVIPAAKVRGGGGGGSDTQQNGGGGFGLSAKPAGAWVIRGDEVTWQPALDLNRVILGGQVVAIVFFLVLRAILKSRRRSDQRFDPTGGRHYHGRSRGGAVVARRAHNPKVGGSNPSPATTHARSKAASRQAAFVHPGFGTMRRPASERSPGPHGEG